MISGTFDAIVGQVFGREVLVHMMMKDKLEIKGDFVVTEWEVIEHCILVVWHNKDYYKGYFLSIKRPDRIQLL